MCWVKALTKKVDNCKETSEEWQPVHFATCSQRGIISMIFFYCNKCYFTCGLILY